MEIRIALTPKQIEFARAVDTTPKTFYGGSKGGGKSHGLRLIMLKRRFQYPGSIGYLFRSTYPELEANHITPLFDQFPDLRDYYNEGKKTLHLPNGSRLRFAYVEHKKDLRKFQGREMHDLAIEEAGEWPFEHYEYLEKQRRTADVNIPARTLLTGNPGGIGHTWLKRLFIDKRLDPGQNPADYAYIPARVEDNPALMAADPNYVKELESIKNEMLRRAWRFGDWNITAGQFYNEIDARIHLIKPFEIPDHWQRSGAYDYGFGHPAVAAWFATDEDGNSYCYDGIYRARTKIDDYAQEMLGRSGTAKIIPWWAGHDCWARKAYAFGHDLVQPTIAEAFAKHGIFLKPANTDRVLGARQLRDYLTPFTDAHGQISSKLRFFDTPSVRLIFDSIARAVHDPDKIEDVLKVDAENGDPETGDDGYDCVRMWCMSRPLVSKPLPKPDRYKYQPKPKQVNWATV